MIDPSVGAIVGHELSEGNSYFDIPVEISMTFVVKVAFGLAPIRGDLEFLFLVATPEPFPAPWGTVMLVGELLALPLR